MKYFTPEETRRRAEALRCYQRQVDSELPEFLYHYTTSTGLLGIVKSGTLWMSDSQSMNDSQEISYFKELVKQTADNICNNNQSGMLTANYKNFVLELANFAMAQVGNIFIASLSEHRDQLSQWRAYTAGSSGFALGLKTDRLVESVNNFQVVIGKCNYNQADAYTAANEIIRCFIEEFFKDDEAILDYQSITYEFNRTIHMVAPFFKNPAFSEEAEWRVFMYSHWQDSRLEYRNTATQIIPFIALDIKSLATPISSQSPNFHLICGPGMQSNSAAAQGIFFRYLKSNVQVGKSEAPYVSR